MSRRLGHSRKRLAHKYGVKFKPLLVGLLAPALTLLVLFTSAVPSYTQTPPPADIRSEVRALAASDVEEGISRRNNDAVKLFSGNASGLTDPEIWKVYDEEYTRQSKAKKPDPRELLKLENGWWAAFLAVVGAIFWDKLSKWVTALWDGASNAIFNRFAGNKIFWQRALTRYRQALIKEYRKRKSIFQQEDQLLDLQQVYVSLQVKGKHDDCTQLETEQAIAEFSRLMILGIPGAGKSMLLWNIAVRYAEGNPIAVPKQPIPIVLNLHDLNDSTLSIQQQLVKALAIGSPSAFPKADRFVDQALKQQGLLLLLDGLDEVNSANRAEVVQRVRTFLDSHDCRAVITCRTAVYQNDFKNEVDRTLEVREFSDQQIRLFLEGWKPYMPPEKSIEQLIRALSDRPRILTIARNPLLLSIIAFLYINPRFILPHSRAEFYQEATDILLKKLDQARVQNQFTAINKRMVLRHLALYYQTSANQRQDHLSVDYETVLAQIQQELPQLNLATEQAKPFLDEVVERSGLLLPIDDDQRYQFAHLTLQEFLAAEELRERETDLITFFGADQDTWRETVKLWCGLAGDSTRLIERVLEIEPITAFECLAEAQRVDSGVAEQIINQFKTRLSSPDEKDAITQAFGTVAADTREDSRGRAVFQFLKLTVANSGEPNHRIAAANALSLTNLSESAQILAGRYSQWTEVRRLLVRMGDLAIPELATLARSGSTTALDDLMAIGTIAAASALTDFLWHPQKALAERSAWHLAAFLPQVGVEEALHDYPLQAAQRQANYLDWIWQPFDTPPDSALPILAGRIAYLLAQTTKATAPNPLPIVDARLVIPLCSIHLIEQFVFPTSYSAAEADSLLQRAATSTGLDLRLRQYTKQSLGVENTTSYWYFLFSCLPPQLQLELLNRLMQFGGSTHQNWRNLFRPITYEFQTGWHYRVVLAIAAIASAAALCQSFYLPIHEPQNWLNWLALFTGVVIADFWLFLWKGIEHRLEPDLFVTFGLLGLKTFSIELYSLWTNRLVWVGANPLLKILSSSFAVTVAGAFAFAVAFAFAGAGAFAFAGAGAGAVAGLAAWYSLKSNPERKWLRVLAIFSFPWFCWFPITLSGSTFALYNLLTKVSPLSFPIWQQTAIVASAFAGLCAALWWRGQWLDTRTSNPFQGGVLGAALGVKR